MSRRCIVIDQFAYFAGCPIVLPSAKTSRRMPANWLITFPKRVCAMFWHRPCFYGGRFPKTVFNPPFGLWLRIHKQSDNLRSAMSKQVCHLIPKRPGGAQ